MMRQRKKEDEPTEPMDEAEQEETIKKLESELTRQEEVITSTFSIICKVATATGIASAILVDQRSSQPVSSLFVSHAVLAAAIHWMCPQIVTGSTMFPRYFVPVTILVILNATIAMYISRKQTDDIRIAYHQVLLVCTLILIGGSLFLRSDRKQTVNLLSDLKIAKYKFKSL